jgi:rhamnosyltransferase
MDTLCIITLYEPTNIHIDNINKLFLYKKFKICVIWNGGDINLLNLLKNNSELELIIFSENIGLSIAINTGIDYGLKDFRIKFFLFLDQDSTIELNDYEILKREIICLINLGQPVGLLCPTLIDESRNTAYDQSSKDSSTLVTEINIAATSGCLMPKSALIKIGRMDENLFIDFIDYEWCLRARSLNFKIYRSNKSRMLHNIGNYSVNIFGQIKPIHLSPYRQYYIIRNYFHLLRLKHIDTSWKLLYAFKTIRRFFYYFIFASNIYGKKLICKALLDGISNKFGKLEQ